MSKIKNPLHRATLGGKVNKKVEKIAQQNAADDAYRQFANRLPNVRNGLKLSEQAIACLIVAFQKVQFEGLAIDVVLSEFKWTCDGGGELFVENPPRSVMVSKEFLESLGDSDELWVEDEVEQDEP